MPKPEVTPMSAVSYEADGRAISLGFDADSQRLWATQADMAALYGVDQSVISRHIRNVFRRGGADRRG